MNPPLILDLSRLLWRSGRQVPTGIDRVELEYAKHFIASAGDRLDFVASTLTGHTRFLPQRLTRRFVLALDRVWQGDNDGPGAARTARRLAMMLRLSLPFGGRRRRAAAEPPIYLHVSHHHLDRPKVIERFKAWTGARILCLVHDLIPIDWPEYVRPGHDRRHTARIETVARYADGIILNSAATGRSLQPFLDRAGRQIPAVVAPLGVPDTRTGPRAEASEPPYFITIGTIEPRKNHLLLLTVWRDIAAELGANAPHLVVIGQRGWENENVVDLLERSPSIRRTVREYNSLPDAEMTRLLTGARALLMPSFAEGYGLPIAEALAAGVPVICTPLPPFKEVGGDVPDYRDAIDGLGWRAAIIDYAAEDSFLRPAQLARLAHWQRPTWADHFAQVAQVIETLGAP